LAMKSPTQSVRYRVRRAGATPSGRARSIGRGWEDCQGSGCFSTDPAKAYKYGSDQERTLVDFGRQPWPDVSTPEISRRSRLAGGDAVSPDIDVSTDRDRQQAGSCRRGAEREIGRRPKPAVGARLPANAMPSAPSPFLIHRVRQQAGSYRCGAERGIGR
jgi:hypothetical protein